jgi:hypothetical protein
MSKSNGLSMISKIFTFKKSLNSKLMKLREGQFDTRCLQVHKFRIFTKMATFSFKFTKKWERKRKKISSKLKRNYKKPDMKISLRPKLVDSYKKTHQYKQPHKIQKPLNKWDPEAIFLNGSPPVKSEMFHSWIVNHWFLSKKCQSKQRIRTYANPTSIVHWMPETMSTQKNQAQKKCENM